MANTFDWTFPATSFAYISGMWLAIFSAAKLADDVFGSGPLAKKFGKYFRNSTKTPTLSRAYVGSTFLMEIIFGRKIFSLKAAVISITISIVWIGVLITSNIAIAGRGSWVFNEIFSRQVIINFWGFFLIGIIADYLSTCTSRAILSIILDKDNRAKLLWLITTTVTNSLIFYIIFVGAKSLFLSQPATNPISQIKIWLSSIFNLQLVLKTLDDWILTPTAAGQWAIENGTSEIVYAFPEGLLFLSNQLTLTWLIMQTISQWIYFNSHKISRLMERMINESSLESRPLQSATTILGLLSLLPAWCILLLWHYSPSIYIYLFR